MACGCVAAALWVAGAAVAAGPHDRWVATWTASMSSPLSGLGTRYPNPGVGFTDQTLRMIIHSTIGGNAARVRLSNVFGTSALAVGEARLAIRQSGAAIYPGSDRQLTFGGNSSVSIPAGALIVSDPVLLDVPENADLAVSLYFPGPTGPPTNHPFSMNTNYYSQPGNHAAAVNLPLDATQYCFVIGGRACQYPWFFVSGVEVVATKQTDAIVTLGDSITDGDSNLDQTTQNKNLKWPSILATRLLARNGNHDIAVLNAGIAGNRVLADNSGALTRLDRDVLVESGAKWVILMEGINDINGASASATPNVADRLIAAYRQIIDRAHAMGLTIYGVTITPAGYAPEDFREGYRSTVNQWIRTSGAFDGVIDFDAVTRDPANPTFFLPQYDSGDHLHPTGVGYQAMGDSIDLKLFQN